MTVRHRDLCRHPDKVLEAAADRFLVTVDLAGDGDMNWNLRPLSRDYDFQAELEQAYAGVANEEREPLDQLAADYDTVVGANDLLQA